VPDSGLPHYPNYRATFGTSLAVVTSLMASISTAIVVVLSVDNAAETGLGFLSWTPDQIGTATGSAAVSLFVAATLGAVYAQAANHEDLPRRVIYGLFKDRTDQAERIKDWDRRGDTAYKCTRIFWITGVSLLLVTLGILAYGKLPGELPLMGIVAIAVVVLNLLDPDFRSTGPIALSVIVAVGCGVIAVSAAQAVWF
jgi:hypothetical protein